MGRPMDTQELIAIYRSGNYDAVIKWCERKLKGKDKNNLTYLSLMGGALLKAKKGARAVAVFTRAYKLSSDVIHAHNLGRAYCDVGDFKKAIPLLKRYHDANRADPDGILTLALAYARNGDLKRAETLLAEGLAGHPEDQRFIKNLALNAVDAGSHKKAMHWFEMALRSDPENVDLILSYTKLLESLSRIDHAFIWVNRALQLDSSGQLSNFMAGKIIATYHVDADPLPFLEKALDGDDADIVDSALSVLMTHLEASRDFISLDIWVRKIVDGHFSRWAKQVALTKEIGLAIRTCQWARLEKHVTKPEILDGLDPFIAAHVIDDPSRLLRLSGRQSESYKPAVSHDVTLPEISPRSDGFITLGFFGGEFQNHPVTHLLVGVIKNLNPNRFRVVIFSNGKVEDASTLVVKSLAYKFIDISKLNDIEVMSLSIKNAIDVAIDLNGYSGQTRIGLFANRFCSKQLSYLGFPLSTGSDFFDGIILDDVVAPKDAEKDFSEVILRMPSCFMPRDDTVIPTDGLTRSEYGLPDDIPILACYHKPEKITRDMFDCWCNICASVDGLIWLPQIDLEIYRRLVDYGCNSFGLRSEQFQMASRLDSMEEHLGRLRLADLFLDSYPYGGHTTFGDFLYAGVPCLTRFGASSVSRLGLSHLTDLGLSELAVATKEEYTRRAISLINDKNKLRNIRDILVARYDSRKSLAIEYARNFEQLIIGVIAT